MAAEFFIEDHFNCSPKALYDMLCDNAFYDNLMKSLNVGKQLLSEEKLDNGMQYKIRLTNPEEIPAIAKKFTGEHLVYVETRRWSSQNLGNTWVIEPEVSGVKVEAKGVTEIVAEGEGCIRRTKGSVNVSLPLIGKKIEEMVLQSIQGTFKKNAEYCKQYIAEHQL